MEKSVHGSEILICGLDLRDGSPNSEDYFLPFRNYRLLVAETVIAPVDPAGDPWGKLVTYVGSRSSRESAVDTRTLPEEVSGTDLDRAHSADFALIANGEVDHQSINSPVLDIVREGRVSYLDYAVAHIVEEILLLPFPLGGG